MGKRIRLVGQEQLGLVPDKVNPKRGRKAETFAVGSL
jgi:hypothetical protein